MWDDFFACEMKKMEKTGVFLEIIRGCRKRSNWKKILFFIRK